MKRRRFVELARSSRGRTWLAAALIKNKIEFFSLSKKTGGF